MGTFISSFGSLCNICGTFPLPIIIILTVHCYYFYIIQILKLKTFALYLTCFKKPNPTLFICLGSNFHLNNCSSALRTYLNISLKAGLLAMNSLCVWSLKKSLFCLYFWKVFSLGVHFRPTDFSWTIWLHYLLACIVYDEKCFIVLSICLWYSVILVFWLPSGLSVFGFAATWLQCVCVWFSLQGTESSGLQVLQPEVLSFLCLPSMHGGLPISPGERLLLCASCEAWVHRDFLPVTAPLGHARQGTLSVGSSPFPVKLLFLFTWRKFCGGGDGFLVLLL